MLGQMTEKAQRKGNNHRKLRITAVEQKLQYSSRASWLQLAIIPRAPTCPHGCAHSFLRITAPANVSAGTAMCHTYLFEYATATKQLPAHVVNYPDVLTWASWRSRRLGIDSTTTRLTTEARTTVVTLHQKGFKVKAIRKRLEEQVFVSRAAIFKLLRKYRVHGIVGDLPRPQRARILTDKQLIFIDEALADNDELTARQLRGLIQDKWPETSVSISTIKHARKNLGWVATRPRYCQLIREANKEKHLVWCKERLEDDESFEDVVFSDECSVEQDSHGRLCFRRKKEQRKLKPRPKHPVKVHVWAGISHHGPTPV